MRLLDLVLRSTAQNWVVVFSVISWRVMIGLNCTNTELSVDLE